jgi:hypothetical protein
MKKYAACCNRPGPTPAFHGSARYHHGLSAEVEQRTLISADSMTGLESRGAKG